MPTNFQDNILKRKEIHVNPSLWRDKIYYLERNPYWNSSYNFIPTPKKYAEIIQEFHEEIDKQKKQVEKVATDKKEAEERIKEIRQELREWIETIIATYSEPNEEEQERLKVFNHTLRSITLRQWKKWVEENLPKEEIIEDDLYYYEDEEFELKTQSENQKLEVREKIAPSKIRELVQEWEEQAKKIQTDYNSCFILEHDEDNLVFTFQPPRQIFVNLKEFLFYRNNAWYEVVSWSRINSWNAVIIVKRSIFLSYYHYFLAKGANGIMHASPRISREICQCPSFLESNQTEEYACDWEPHYELWRIKNALAQTIRHSLGGNNPAPYISTVELERVTELRSADSLTDTTYLLLPKGYSDGGTWWSDSSSAMGNKITFSDKQKGLFSEERWQNHTGNELNHHTKHHVNLQFFWRKKMIGKYTLSDFDPNNCYLKIKANGSSIIYTLQSKFIWLRWSEDVKTTIEKDRMMNIFSGILNKVTGVNLSEATKSLFHDLNTEESKSQDERESERRTKYDGTAQVVSSAMGSLPSMMATSHTKHDYTSSEFALRYEAPSLKVRISYNHNTFDRYKMEKQLKRNGNEWFNWAKIGNYLNKGYWKIVPHIFEGDREGFFASIFSKGVYLYEENPHEYFTTKLAGGKYTSNVLVGGNSQIESIFQKDLEETGGHDNVSQAGGGLWVYKTSYIKRQDGSSDNIFVRLMEQANSYRNHSYENSDRWVFKHPQTWSTEINMDEYATYVYDLKFFSSDHKNTHGVKGATKIVAEQIAEGNRSAIKVRFIGNLEIKKGQDDPNEIGSTLTGTGGAEQMPEIPAEKNDEFIDGLEKINQPEAEQQIEDEIQDELQEELQTEPQKEDEKQEELEQEDEKNKERQKQKERQNQKQEQKQQEEEDNVERSNEK